MIQKGNEHTEEWAKTEENDNQLLGSEEEVLKWLEAEEAEEAAWATAWAASDAANNAYEQYSAWLERNKKVFPLRIPATKEK